MRKNHLNKNFFLILSIFLYSLSAFAQEAETLGLSYLNELSFLGQNSEADLNLATGLSNGLEIKETNSFFHLPKTSKLLAKQKQHQKYYNILLVGVLTADSESLNGQKMGINFPHFIRGIQVHRLLNLGIGIGFDSYKPEFIPIYFDLRGYVLKKAWSPYYAFSIGYAYSVDLFNNWDSETTDLKGGIMIHPAVGVRIATQRNHDFLIEVGYKLQKGEVHYDQRNYLDRWIYERISFRLGAIF